MHISMIMSLWTTCRRYYFMFRTSYKKTACLLLFLSLAWFIYYLLKDDWEYHRPPFETIGESHFDSAVHVKDNIGCRLPKVEPFSKEMMSFIEDFGTLKCDSKAPALASLNDKGFLRIRGTGLTSAKYTAILRAQGDDYTVSKGESVDIPLKKLESGEMFGEIQVPVEYIRVDIKTKRMAGFWADKETTEYFLNAPKKEEVDKRTLQWPGIPLSIMLVLFDSTSAANVERKMPKTFKALKNNPDAVMLKGYSTVGDGTGRALSAFLTGEHEGNNPEARKGIPGAEPVDRWEWIFKEYKEKGYSTLYAEDFSEYAAFNYRHLGFKDPPADYYGRPLFLESDRDGYTLVCLKSHKRHLLLQQYIKRMYFTYPKRPKFSVAVSNLGHGNLNEVQWIDKDIADLLQWAKKDNNTLMIFMSDHGIRYGPVRAIMQGQLEERLPFISMVFPSWFKEKFPDLFQSLRHNVDVLTTPFDLHATFRHILSYPEKPSSKYGQSLFTTIDISQRTCDNAGVKVYFCPCLNWYKISLDDDVVRNIVENTISVMNTKILSFTEECEKLSLKNITHALRQKPNEKALRFKHVVRDNTQQHQPTKYILGKTGEDNMKKNAIYQVQFFVSPSGAQFEATIPLNNGTPVITLESIHRVNQYGSQPDCIKNKFPHLAYFCLCKDKTKRKSD